MCTHKSENPQNVTDEHAVRIFGHVFASPFFKDIS
jgi:hypothetical protein